MTDWRTVKSLATERDDCSLCKWSHQEPALLLCEHPDAIGAVFGRDRVAASVARADWCDGRKWARIGNSPGAHQNGAGSVGAASDRATQPRDHGDALEAA